MRPPLFPLPPTPRILIRGTNWLGDAVMTTPALIRLREYFPNATLTMLCPEKLRDLWLNHPAVAETISFAPGESIFAVGKKLRAAQFDLALVLPNSPRSALEVFLAGIPQRIGYARSWRNLFLTRAIGSRSGAVKMRKRSVAEIRQRVAVERNGLRKHESIPSQAHQIHEYLHLAGALGASLEPIAPHLAVTASEIEAAKTKWGLAHLSGPVLGLNPGAEYGPAKRWPIAKFIAAAKALQQRTGCVCLLFGGKNDQHLTAQIAAALPPASVIDTAGKTTLRELMALLKLCRVLLTNDTGPMHVAAALGTPVVVPFGSTSLELTGPGLPGDGRHRLLKSGAPCSPCFLRECPIDFRCLNDVHVAAVLTAIEPMLISHSVM